MSFFGSIGNAIKKGVVGAGHLAGKVLSNPIVEGASAFIPGVGPLITAGEGALGGLLKPGGNLGGAISGGLQGAAAGIAGGGIRKLGSGILQNGIGSVLSGGLRSSGTFAPGGGSGGGSDPYGNIIDYDAGGNPIYAGEGGGGGGQGGGIGNDILGGLRKLGSGLSGGQNGGINFGNLAIGGLAGYQALNAANASKRAGQLSDKALAMAESRYNAAAPLREQGMAHLLNPQRPDLTSVYQDASNPFAVRKLAPPAPALTPGAPAPGGVLGQLKSLQRIA